MHASAMVAKEQKQIREERRCSCIVTPRSSNSKFPEFMLLRGDTSSKQLTAAMRHF